MCIFISSIMSPWNSSHYNKNRERYEKIYILVFLHSTLYSFSILMKLEFSRKFFERNSNIKFYENHSICNWVVPCGQTDGRTDGRTDVYVPPRARMHVFIYDRICTMENYDLTKLPACIQTHYYCQFSRSFNKCAVLYQCLFCMKIL